jgi:hypothetical protein
MLVSSKYNTLTSARGQQVSLLQPLVKRPLGGWQSSITFRGSKIIIPGNSAKETVDALRKILSHNKVAFAESDLWMTLNLDWMSRSPEGDRVVPLAAFIDACVTKGGSEIFAGKVPTDVWLPPVLDSLGHLLGMDAEKFSHDQFLDAVKTLRVLSDPSFSYKTGDAVIFSTVLPRYDNLRYKPCYLIEEAREWFLVTYDSVAPLAMLTKITRTTANLKYNW